MRVDRKWVERNLGFDPIATPPPDATFASARAAKAATPEDFQREIIDFDSESPAGLQFMAFSTATGLSRYTDVEWPKGLAPETGRAPSGSSNSPLPRADVRRILDHDHRPQIGRDLQVGLTHVARRSATAQHRRVASDRS